MAREGTLPVWIALLAAAAWVGISAERVSRRQEVVRGTWNHIWEKTPLTVGGSLLGDPWEKTPLRVGGSLLGDPWEKTPLRVGGSLLGEPWEKTPLTVGGSLLGDPWEKTPLTVGGSLLGEPWEKTPLRVGGSLLGEPWEKTPLTVGGSLLGEPCAINKNCAVSNGMCEKGRCLCMSHYLALNASLCLPGALLGFPCQVDAQCSLRVDHTACIQGYCRCGASYVPYRRNNCLKAARVGDMCRSHQQCQQENRGSFCNFTVPRVYGRCQCSSDVPRHGNTCGQLRYGLGSPCGTSAQCSTQVLGSVCIIQNSAQLQALTDISANSITAIPGIPPTPLGVPLAVCACPPGHLVAENGTRCIPVLKDAGVTPASLGERCESSQQCRASDPYTFCRAGVCHCLHDSPECSAKNRGCHKETFQCASSGRCISWYFVCNGERECEDGSDEAMCLPHRCPPLAHTCTDGTCVSRAHLCDGKPHCPDGSDEASCIGTCPATTFRCGDGRCLPGFVFCNAKPTCRDGSDEDQTACIQGSITAPYCPFRCGNGRCRSTAILCSGTDGCGDNTDEAKCSVCSCRRPS